MKAVFVELPPFERYRKDYLNDEDFSYLQHSLIQNPYAGDVIRGTGGLRKLRFLDSNRGKGKRGGTRIIYYWWDKGHQFWLFTMYGKNEMSDLSDEERKMLAKLLKNELVERKIS